MAVPKCRWGRLNAVAVAANWRLSKQSVINVVRWQVYHTERPPYLFAARSPYRGFVIRQPILVSVNNRRQSRHNGVVHSHGHLRRRVNATTERPTRSTQSTLSASIHGLVPRTTGGDRR